MAPDKIYIHEASATELALPLKDYHIEYICRDTLIEWLKEKRNINLEEADKKNDMFLYGVATGFAAVIDKLNARKEE